VGSAGAEAAVAFHPRAALAAQPGIGRPERRDPAAGGSGRRDRRGDGGPRPWLGLFNVVALPSWAAILLVVVLLDLAIYFQHVLFHAVPVLWRLHRVHHADEDFDVTTGLRFHPIEILLSLGIKCAVIAALGAPAIAVLAFEVLLNGASMFNHANARLPLVVDRWLALARRHAGHAPRAPLGHSTRVEQQLRLQPAVVGHLFGTYRAQRPPATRRCGSVSTAAGPEEVRLTRLLTQPLRDVSPAASTTKSQGLRCAARHDQIRRQVMSTTAVDPQCRALWQREYL